MRRSNLQVDITCRFFPGIVLTQVNQEKCNSGVDLKKKGNPGKQGEDGRAISSN